MRHTDFSETSVIIFLRIIDQPPLLFINLYSKSTSGIKFHFLQFLRKLESFWRKKKRKKKNQKHRYRYLIICHQVLYNSLFQAVLFFHFFFFIKQQKNSDFQAFSFSNNAQAFGRRRTSSSTYVYHKKHKFSNFISFFL